MVCRHWSLAGRIGIIVGHGWLRHHHAEYVTASVGTKKCYRHRYHVARTAHDATIRGGGGLMPRVSYWLIAVNITPYHTAPYVESAAQHWRRRDGEWRHIGITA